ncbi:14698_t:CDS:2 [Entrophospora sp. SA101]|nr:14698_t:CDS:2 [Entrophospora sp. SA101]
MSSDEQKYDDIPRDVINKRIQFEDQLATIHYVCPVPPTKGIWYGVEWDNISRGKHDGLQKDLDTIYWAGNTKIEVEAIGWEKICRKQRQLDRLTEVGLSFERISNAGKPGEIETTCPSFNYIKNFGDIDGEKENQIKKSKIKGFSKLKTLNLESNIIDSWDEIARFSGLPHNNLINNIYYPKGVDNQEFPKLKYLNVSENKINDWQNVNELNSTYFCIYNIDIKADEAYILIVGRIKELKMMDGSLISSNDRIDTERYYLRLCIKDLKSPDEIEKHHPRFKELCEIHGEPTFDDRSLKATTLTITHRKSLDEEPIKIISKKLLGTLTLRNLKNIFQKSFGIPASQQRLYGVIKDETVKGTSISKKFEN